MRRSLLSSGLPPALVGLAARLRRRAARRRSAGRLVAVACIAAGAWAGWTTLGAAADRRDAWGTTVPVAVADVDLRPGDHAGPATASLRAWPAALAPPGALQHVPEAVVRQDVAAGEPLGAADIGAAPGPAGLLPAGWVAVAVPVDERRRPPLATADRVGVVVGDLRVVGGAVVDVDAALVVVAVPAADAGGVASAALDGTVGLVLEPDPG